MSDNAAAARAQCHALFNNAAFADVVLAADEAMTRADDGTVTTRRSRVPAVARPTPTPRSRVAVRGRW